MIKLYGMAVSSNVNKVRYCLNYLSLKFDFEEINVMAGENRTQAFLNISPTGKIPAIDIDGFKLFESNSIIRYLASANRSSIYPHEPKKRAIVDAWMDYGAIHVAHAMGRVLYNRVFAPMAGEKVDPESLRVGIEFLDKYFPVLERQLFENAYLAGKDFSLADINLLAVLDPLELGQIGIERYPSLKKWRLALKTQSFYQKCYKDYTEFAQEAMGSKSGR